ncbi:retron Ec78 anti-phage system effector HNH endonuclease PtuB [Candidatus Venteria ishoeyi]|uniref:retron Ec78 anti-phage system effector HNH endonuclease PtuB n=1 Tax=Candidatus Venteria ishoeyi TaxID=1899563 RepID=UPI0025A539D0|nr:retron Ec78 anti-phage system effector HNH endonuclease PtuB [Candidatus Venteria ishoeyi]MDM8547202.1 retron Ec78 anti-phage system effector HNH endonuclease PtuB [Candidatus Venteria ishoeyi]
MHKLDRPRSPTCLGQYQHGRDNWGSVSHDHKSDIWLKLDEMQQHRCAYCEAEIKTDRANSHIEHLRQRCSYPQGTFLWRNIFGSCNRQDSCGKYKDALPPYNYQDLIKMDEEDPERFLEFLPDGSITPAKGLNPNDKHRAQETIRIFHLNGSLRQIRETAVKGYLQTAEELASLAAEFDEADWLPLLQDELDSIKNLPFSTAIKHVLLPA